LNEQDNLNTFLRETIITDALRYNQSENSVSFKSNSKFNYEFGAPKMVLEKG